MIKKIEMEKVADAYNIKKVKIIYYIIPLYS